MTTQISQKLGWLQNLPSGWGIKGLRFMLERNDGGAWGSDPTGSDDVIVLRSTEQTVDGQWIITDPARRALSTAEHEATCLAEGDLLVTKSSGSETHIGKTTIVDSEVALLRAGYSNFMQRLRTNEGTNPRFAWYLLNSPHAKIQLNLESTTSTGLANLNGGLLGRLVFPCPPLQEQIAISAYLDAETLRIDRLIEAKRQLLQLLQDFGATAFLNTLSSAVASEVGQSDDQIPWLSKLPKSWSRCRVKHLVISFDQGVSPQCESRVPNESEWGVLKVGCVNTGQFDPNESKALPNEIPPVPEVTVDEGDLLVSRANTKSLVGRAAVAARSYPRLMLSDKLYRLKLDSERCLPEFVRHVMWVPAVRQMIEERATGASPSMLNIDRRTILEIVIPLPSIAEQSMILEEAKVAGSMASDLIRHVECEIETLRDLRSSTITEAVLGRIDVRSHTETE